MSTSFDVIVIGAGSVGTPAAMYLAERGLSVLCIDRAASAGQGNNKCAIGGIRATHSETAKVKLCLHSLEVFRSWEEEHGDDISWFEGGYTYVAYADREENLLRGMLTGQRAAGLEIDWVGAEELTGLVPGICREGLRGGTWSPRDGSASPMQAVYAFCRRARRLGAVFRFGETVTSIETAGGRIESVRTDRGSYSCGAVVNCAGSAARAVGTMTGLDLPVHPDCHEAGVTEPVQRFFTPMVVDIRRIPGSANYYFYQHDTGQVVFCITPDPPIPGDMTTETSGFLPLVAPRMTGLLPRLANLKVRRTWRGSYPQTPDGSPVVGKAGAENCFLAVGMCGQGFMLGPGVGALVSRMVVDDRAAGDDGILEALSPGRVFGGQEALK
jgi:sarcosine oxidase subunit beta